MSEINITVGGGTSKRLLTAGKYCDRDIVVTATGTLVVNPKETSIFDPTKETILTRSTATQREVVLSKTTIAYINSGKYAGYLGCKFDAVVGKTYRISWEQISSSEDFLFWYESDEILTKVDDHYGTRIQHVNNPFILTTTKPYVYLWLGHPSVPSTELVLVTGLMVHEVDES